MSDLERPIVIDCGAFTTKVGYAGNNHPQENMYADDVLHTKFETLHSSSDDGRPSPSSSSSSTIVNGYINNMEHFDTNMRRALLGHMSLTTDTIADHAVLLAESPLAAKTHSESLTQYFFETFSVPGFFLANQGVLAMYCSGKVNGIVLEMGHSRSFVCPVYEGFALTHACEREPFVSGSEMSLYLQRILMEAEKSKQIQVIKGGSSSGSNGTAVADASGEEDGDVNMESSTGTHSNDGLVFSDMRLVNHVKHEICHVALNPFSTNIESSSSSASSSSSITTAQDGGSSSSAGEKSSSSSSSYEKSFTLPDGTTIIVSDHLRRQAAELLFDPYRTCGKPIPNIAQTLYNCVMECESEIRKELLSNILLSGGISNMSGMQSRLRRELEQIAPPSTMLTVNLPNNATIKARDETVWCGGSILASLPLMKDLWIRKKDYNECGPSIVWRKVLS